MAANRGGPGSDSGSLQHGKVGDAGASSTSGSSALSYDAPGMMLNRTATNDVRLCYDGHDTLAVPGFSGIPIDYEYYAQNRFTHGGNEWAQRPNLTARELAMLGLINDLTEEHHWHEKIFDKHMMSDWRTRASSGPLLSPKAWDWCLAELRDKARSFEQAGDVVVFNTGAGVVKTDAVGANVQIELRDGATLLEAEKDPKQQVMYALVDPELFPLMYGKTRVLMYSSRVSLDELLDSCGKGEVVPPFSTDYLHRRRPTLHYGKLESMGLRASECGQERWSSRFQQLPCEVEFVKDFGVDVRITSYVNNLHPVRFRALYETIARVISRSIEPWNKILIKQNQGRYPKRIRTYGVEGDNEIPEWAGQERLRVLKRDRGSTAFKEAVGKVKDWLALLEDDEIGPWASQIKVVYLRKWRHPEPGTAFSYDEWKAGRAGKTIVDRKLDDPELDAQHNFYQVNLQDSFRKQGLQVAIKISTIDLTSDTPSYDGTDWQLDGMMNDHIVASALCVFEVRNMTEVRLSFRQETKNEHREFRYNAWFDLDRLMAVFAIPGDSEDIGDTVSSHPPSLQELGSIHARKGRLIAWPNVLHHRMEPIKLADATKPGHCKYISLHLVDPDYRICSTRNVPPQRHDWWAGKAIEATGAVEHGVPQELLHMIDAYTDDWPMGMNEAEGLRSELVRERDAANRYIMSKGASRYFFDS